jgi:transcriptional regulator with GAF, ATPase, and Fis domain
MTDGPAKAGVGALKAGLMTTVADTAPEELRRLDEFHNLLPTLSQVLDVREVFTQVSTIAARVIPHDEANLALFVANSEQVRLLVSTHTSPGAEPSLIGRGCHCFLDDPGVPSVCGDLPQNSRGLRSGVRAPIRIGDELVGVILLLSRTPRFYSRADLPLLERIADYIAISVSHQRLADASKQAAVDRERADALATSEELLRAVSSVLDIRQVFPELSEIAQKVLPHDRLTMSFHDREGNMVIEAASNEDVPAFRIQGTRDDERKNADYFIVDDFRDHEHDKPTDPPDLKERVIAAGYRSLLVVHLYARDQGLGLEFWSKQPAAFTTRDVPIARRIGDHVALAVSHEQLAEAARQAADARTRAERLEARVKSLSDELDSKSGYGRVVGQSPSWGAVVKQATQVAETDTTVLLTGESGTGKEVVARYVHRASARRTGPFVALNCAALPEQLLESELFGYERGAFTGAQQAKPGQIEMAAGGTLFLDEVAEMSPSAQAKFLRVLQEREFQRLGGTRVLKANVRIIAATNRDLRKAMDRGDFREDLYYRLRVFDIRIPPLRDRIADILPLSEAFLDEIGKSFGRPPAGMTRDAQDALLRHRWPGNVRELRNALERAAILCEGGLIAAEHFSFPFDEPLLPIASNAPATSATPHAEPNGHGTTNGAYANGHGPADANGNGTANGHSNGNHTPIPATTTDLNIVEREMITQVMRESGGNKSKAATRLGLTRSQLYVRLRRYSLE